MSLNPINGAVTTRQPSSAQQGQQYSMQALGGLQDGFKAMESIGTNLVTKGPALVENLQSGFTGFWKTVSDNTKRAGHKIWKAVEAVFIAGKNIVIAFKNFLTGMQEQAQGIIPSLGQKNNKEE